MANYRKFAVISSNETSSHSAINTENPEAYSVYKYQGAYSSGVEPIRNALDSYSPNPRFDAVKGKIRWGGIWTKWNKEALRPYLTLGPPFYYYDLVSEIPIYGSELLRFLKCLEIWERTPGTKIHDAQDVWINSLTKGPAYAEELSDLFALTWRENDMDSYNFVFPSRFLPRFEEDTDDLALSKDRVYSDPDVLEEFKQTLEELLEEIPKEAVIELPDDAQILFERSTTTSYLWDENRKLPHWEASLTHQDFEKDVLCALRQKVPVYPGGTRDTIIADINCNNSIRWLERAFRHILEYVPESAVCVRSSTFESRLNDVVYKEGSHVLRDIKKCGITYNVKDIFPVIKKCVMKRFPDERWNRMNMFSRMLIRDENGEFEAHRGYGLGMANHIVTLSNIVICRMAIRSIPRNFKHFKCKAILGNDDADVVFYYKDKFNTKVNTKKIAYEYLELEHDIHGRLGNLTNFKKSVISKTGLFYETYNKDGWRDKEALVCNALACAYLAPSVRIAKHYIYSQSDRFSSLWARNELIKLAHFWGAEFYSVRCELKIHYECGGWLNTKSNGLKTTLCDIEYLYRSKRGYKDNYIHYCSLYAKTFITPPSPVHENEGYVTNFKYRGYSKRTDPKVQIYFLSEKDLRTYYRKLTTYQRNYSKRLESFDKRTKRFKITGNIEDVQLLYMKNKPYYQIPNNLVVEDSDKFPCTISCSTDTEYVKGSEDVIQVLIDKEKGLNDTITYENTVWDPIIPERFAGATILTNMVQIYTASQFSNSGVMPSIDYFYRWQEYPVCKLIGRPRIPNEVRYDESIFGKHRLSNLSRHKEKVFYDENNEVIQSAKYEIDEFGYVIDFDMDRNIDDYPSENQDAFEHPELKKSLEKFEKSKQEKEAQEAKNLERIDYMLSNTEAFFSGGPLRGDASYSLINPDYQEENQVDVFDNSDEEMGLDFF